MLWPTIAFPAPLQYGPDKLGSYCQGLALEDGARPWVVHRDELIIYDLIDLGPIPPSEILSTVHTEEVLDEGEEEHVMVNV